MDCEESTSRLCNDCVYSLIEYGILPSTVKSYILTNTEKDLLIKNYNRFVRNNQNSEDLIAIKKCLDILSKENKCGDCRFNITGFAALRRQYPEMSPDPLDLRIQEKIETWKQKCGESGLIEDREDLEELEENEIPYLDIMTQGPIEKDDVFVLNGKCFSKFGLREWALNFVDRTSKPTNPLTREELTLETIKDLGLDPKEFRYTYREGMEELKQAQSWLRRLRKYYTLEQLENLTMLELVFLDLTEIPKVLRYLPSLQRLYLYDNQITKLENLDALPENLQELYLYRNEITKLENLDSLPDSLQRLNLSGNQITKLENLDSLPENLKDLSLGGNKITKLENLDSLPDTLQRLYLKGNNITQLENLDSLPDSLQDLNLSSNQIKNLENLGTLPRSLRQLDLNRNLIEKIENVDNLPEDLILNLKNNPIDRSTIPVYWQRLSPLIFRIKRNSIQSQTLTFRVRDLRGSIHDGLGVSSNATVKDLKNIMSRVFTDNIDPNTLRLIINEPNRRINIAQREMSEEEIENQNNMNIEDIGLKSGDTINISYGL